MFSNSMKVVGFFLCVQISYSVGMILLRDECPSVKVDPQANETDPDCSPCFDCGYSWGSMCCPNKCGTYSCTFVANPCKMDGIEYGHHRWMPLPNDYEKDSCGDCWCQDGKKQCYTYPCSHGARP